MAAGTLLYAIGFSMYGYVSLYVLFLVAMAIITIGEMLVTPVSESIVAGLAPEEMRGRYMAVYGFSWLLPFAIGPFLAGLIMDNYDPRWVWYSAGIIGVLSAATYFGLEKKVQQVRYNAVEQRIGILENLESGTISAEEAALALEKITEGSLGRLAKAQAQPDQQHLRITVSDPDSGMIKSDLRIPLGLVNTILHGGGRLSSALEGYDQKALIGMIKSSAGDGSPQEMRQGDDHIQVKLE
jgi:MFS family permease